MYVSDLCLCRESTVIPQPTLFIPFHAHFIEKGCVFTTKTHQSPTLIDILGVVRTKKNLLLFWTCGLFLCRMWSRTSWSLATERRPWNVCECLRSDNKQTRGRSSASVSSSASSSACPSLQYSQVMFHVIVTDWPLSAHLNLVFFCSFVAFATDAASRPDWLSALRIYRSVFLVLLLLFFLGINTYGWRASGVNHVLIFELNPRDNLAPQELLEVRLYG